MKKTILTGTVILAFAGANLQTARAGDREWATVGKVLTGVAVAGLIVAATDGHVQGSVNYSYGAPAYCPPPAPPCNATNCQPRPRRRWFIVRRRPLSSAPHPQSPILRTDGFVTRDGTTAGDFEEPGDATRRT